MILHHYSDGFHDSWIDGVVFAKAGARSFEIWTLNRFARLERLLA